ncbi:Ig-like domain-containing protein, partial [Paenibacillus elgii]|uniref:Ig-like domain-containing protein n=1 Tax=Paenibacillus elgii TaxID=189691 RepID=UPI0013D3CAC5
QREIERRARQCFDERRRGGCDHSTLGTVSAVTDNQNGTYTATLTAPTTVGTATISATVGGSAIASTASVQL